MAKWRWGATAYQRVVTKRLESAGCVRSRFRERVARLLPGRKLACVGMSRHRVEGIVTAVQGSSPKRFAIHKIPVGFIVERIA